MNISPQFGTDLLKMLGLEDVKNVYYLKVEVTPDQAPNVEIRCYGDMRALETITRKYQVRELIVDNTVNND